MDKSHILTNTTWSFCNFSDEQTGVKTEFAKKKRKKSHSISGRNLKKI